jgi:uncharacterized membrane protein
MLMSLALFHYKREMRDNLRIPFYPYLPIIAIIGVIAFLVGMPKEALAIGAAMIMALLALYYLLREVERKKIVRIKLFK